MYKGDADWTLIGEVKNNSRMTIPVFGNGDIDSPEKAIEMRDKYGVDGVMIGRASIGYPWIFNEIKHFMATGQHLAAPSLEDRVQAARRHLELAIQWKGEGLAITETPRHYGNYFRDFPNFKDYRMTLVTSNEVDELMATFDAIIEEYGPSLALV